MNWLAGFRRDAVIGWRNLGRNPRRTALAWGAIAIAQIAMVWMACFMKGYTSTLFDTFTGPAVGHLQVHAPRWREDGDMGRTIRDARAVAAAIAGVEGVALVSPRVYGPVLATRGTLGHVAQVSGVDLRLETREGGLLAGLGAGASLRAGEAVLGEGLARELGAKPGNTIAVMGTAADGGVASGLVRVKAVVRTPVDQVNHAGIVLGLAAAQELFAMPDRVHEFVVRCRDAARIPAVAGVLRAHPSVRGLEVLTWRELAPQIASLLTISDTITMVILVLLFVSTVAGVANTMLMATFERSHELGMLLALGVTRGRLVRMLVIEALVLGFAGALIGSAIGMALVWPGMVHGIDLAAITGGAKGGFDIGGMSVGKLYLIPDGRGLWVGVVAVMATSVIAAILPARRIARLNPAEILRS